DRLVAIDAIRQVRARFARALDTKQWQVLHDCLTTDCHFDCTEEEGVSEPWIGADAIVRNISQALAVAVTVHHAHTAEIELLAPDTATGVWAMQDLLRFPGEPPVNVVGFGHYHEEYRTIGEDWPIARYRLTRLRVDISSIAAMVRAPGAAPPPPVRARPG